MFTILITHCSTFEWLGLSNQLSSQHKATSVAYVLPIGLSPLDNKM